MRDGKPTLSGKMESITRSLSGCSPVEQTLEDSGYENAEEIACKKTLVTKPLIFECVIYSGRICWQM